MGGDEAFFHHVNSSRDEETAPSPFPTNEISFLEHGFDIVEYSLISALTSSCNAVAYAVGGDVAKGFH